MITGSTVGKICKKRPETSCTGAVSGILYPIVKRTEALDHGIAMEVITREKLKEQGFNIQECGIFLDSEVLGIGASPDGLVGDDGVLEIKSPYTGRHMDPDDAIRDKKLQISKAFNFKNNEPILKEDHTFYYQVQLQLRVTARDYCLFVISTFKGIKIMKIFRNEAFIQNMIYKACDFYFDCLVPEIVDSRRKRRMPIRDPPYIIQAQLEAKQRKIEKDRIQEEKKEQREVKRSITKQVNLKSNEKSFNEKRR